MTLCSLLTYKGFQAIFTLVSTLILFYLREQILDETFRFFSRDYRKSSRCVQLAIENEIWVLDWVILKIELNVMLGGISEYTRD